MSAVAFFRLKCDGGCDRWLSDITGNDVARLTKVWGRALTFTTVPEAVAAGVTVGWTKCTCPEDIRAVVTSDATHLHWTGCEVAHHVALCGNCRARKQKETETDG